MLQLFVAKGVLFANFCLHLGQMGHARKETRRHHRRILRVPSHSDTEPGTYGQGLTSCRQVFQALKEEDVTLGPLFMIVVHNINASLICRDQPLLRVVRRHRQSSRGSIKTAPFVVELHSTLAYCNQLVRHLNQPYSHSSVPRDRRDRRNFGVFHDDFDYQTFSSRASIGGASAQDDSLHRTYRPSMPVGLSNGVREVDTVIVGMRGVLARSFPLF